MIAVDLDSGFVVESGKSIRSVEAAVVVPPPTVEFQMDFVSALRMAGRRCCRCSQVVESPEAGTD